MVQDSAASLEIGNMYSGIIEQFFETFHIDYSYGVPLLIVIVVGIAGILSLKVINAILIKPYSGDKSKSLVERRIKSYDPELNVDEFKLFIFETYVQICKYWTSHDFTSLVNYLSDDLYTAFCKEYDLLKLNGEQNIINNVNYIYSDINNIRKSDTNEVVEVILTVELNNYTVDSLDNVIKGSKNPMKETYLLTFEKSLVEGANWIMAHKKILKQEF